LEIGVSGDTWVIRGFSRIVVVYLKICSGLEFTMGRVIIRAFGPEY